MGISYDTQTWEYRELFQVGIFKMNKNGIKGDYSKRA